MLKNFLIITMFSIFALSPVFFVSKVEAGIVPDCGKGELVAGDVSLKNSKGEALKDDAGNIIYNKNFKNPCDFTDAMELIKNIIGFLLFYIATPIAGLVICFAGFQLLTSGGSSEKKTKAKHVIMNMILGYCIALGAWLIVNTIFNTLGGNPCQNWLGKTIPDCIVETPKK